MAAMRMSGRMNNGDGHALLHERRPLAAVALAVALLLLPSIAVAQNGAHPAPTQAHPVTMAGDPAAGAVLAANGAAATQTPPCGTCHGRQGQGNATADIPRLAGQGAGYLRHQLEAFVNGERPSAVMTPIAETLNDAQRRNLAAFYAGVAAPVLPPADRIDAAVLRRGEVLSLHGDAQRGVPACSACHGWNGAGNPPDVPYLAGQHAGYLHTELQDWRSSRDSDHRKQMPQIAQRLAPADLSALARYFATLPPPHSLGAAHLPHPSGAAAGQDRRNKKR